LICNPILVETTNNPLMPKVKTPAFFFLGITEINGTSLLKEVEQKFKTIFRIHLWLSIFQKRKLLILALTDPTFR